MILHLIYHYSLNIIENSTIVDNIKKVAKSVKKGVDDLVEGEMDWKEYYNSNPEKGVCFKGRVLVEFKISCEGAVEALPPLISKLALFAVSA